MAVLDTQSPAAQSRGAPSDASPVPAGSRPPAHARRRRLRPGLPTGAGPNLPLVVGGIVVLLLSAVGATLVFRSVGARSAVVVVAVEVPAGQAIERSDLTVTEIGGGEGAEAVAASGLDDLIGRIARSALPAGSVLHPEHLSEAGTAARTVVVGIELEPGALPAKGMESGARVIVLAANDRRAGEDPGPAERIGEVAVTAVTRGEDQRGVTVSLRVPEADVERIAQAAADEQIRLALVEPGETVGADEVEDGR